MIITEEMQVEWTPEMLTTGEAEAEAHVSDRDSVSEAYLEYARMLAMSQGATAEEASGMNFVRFIPNA